MTSTINASTTAGLVQTADTSGVLALQTAGTTAISIDASQAVTMAGRTSNPTTISVGAATPSTSGVGITFPATASLSTNANTLDDYEEGTWTPVFVNWTTTTGWTFPVAKFVKIGPLVYVAVQITPGSVTLSCSANTAYLSGLPFTVSQPHGPVVWSSNFIETLGTGVAYNGAIIYAPALSVPNSREVYLTGVYTTTQ